MSIIVPACARCNQRRGCSELVRFLLMRPSRIAAFLDYLSSLSPDGLRQLDDRVLAEVYAAVWMLRESREDGEAWHTRLKRLCAGRTMHRRRYAARRVVSALGGRLEDLRGRAEGGEDDPPSLETGATVDAVAVEWVAEINRRLIAIFALAWQVSEDVVRGEIARQHERVTRGAAWTGAEGVLELDGWRGRSRKRRMRVDQRRGRGSRGQRQARAAKGRAA